MAIFENKFLSKAGQKERLTNVGATLKAAVTGKGVQSNTGFKVLDKPLSVLASNPFATAGVAAIAVTGLSASAAAVKAAPKTVIGTTLAAPVITSAVVSNPKGAKKAVTSVSGVTKDLSNYAGNLASAKSLGDVIQAGKENPILAGATILAAGAAVKGGVSAISTAVNTGAIRANTAATKDVLDIAKNTGSLGAANAPLSDSQTKFIPESKISQTPGVSSSSQQTPNTPGAYNIQQNNYYSEKYIKKFLHNV